MMSKNLLIAVASLVLVQGCSITVKDRRDAQWDPPPGRALFEQIPNWDQEAARVCGGHLSAQERQRRGLSNRC